MTVWNEAPNVRPSLLSIKCANQRCVCTAVVPMSTVQNEAGNGPDIEIPKEPGRQTAEDGSDLQNLSNEPLREPSLSANVPGTESRKVNGASFAGYKPREEDAEGDASSSVAEHVASPLRAQAPSFEGSFSTPDDTPSVQVGFDCS